MKYKSFNVNILVRRKLKIIMNIDVSKISNYEYVRKEVLFVKLKNNVEIIGRGAFLSTKVSTVRFQNNSNLKKVMAFAFYNCKYLTSIKLPYSITRIGNSAFEGCASLRDIKIPKKTLSIGNKAFKNIAKDAKIIYY
jgi:hypothetical protein